MVGNDIVDNTVTDSVSSGISNLSNESAEILGNVSDHIGFLPDGSADFPGNGIGVQALFMATHETHVLVKANLVRNNAQNGIVVLSEANHILGNTSTGNSLDLADFTFTDSECDSNVWFGNTRGSGGYAPDCTAAGGSGPPNPPLAAASSVKTANEPVPGLRHDLRRS